MAVACVTHVRAAPPLKRWAYEENCIVWMFQTNWAPSFFPLFHIFFSFCRNFGWRTLCMTGAAWIGRCSVPLPRHGTVPSFLRHFELSEILHALPKWPWQVGTKKGQLITWATQKNTWSAYLIRATGISRHVNRWVNKFIKKQKPRKENASKALELNTHIWQLAV